MGNLAISNIAWNRHDDPDIFAILKRHDIGGIEIAPTKIWPEWNGITTASASAYARQLQDEGFVIPSMQAILYGKPDLRIFGDAADHAALCNHMALTADIAAACGAKIMVFGAPKNRDRGDLSEDEAFARAVPVFRDLGEICAARKVVLGFEPNPAAYGCTFVTRAATGAALVRAVNSSGFCLHLDTGGMHMSGDDGPEEIRQAGNLIRHFHISEPNLGNFNVPQVAHEKYAAALESISYKHWLTIEMRGEAGHELDNIERSLRTVRHIYYRILGHNPEAGHAA